MKLEKTMSEGVNEYGQPVGPAVPDWSRRPLPPRTPVAGRTCRVEPVDTERHAADLYEAYSESPDGRDWTYMSTGPFADFAQYREYLAKAALADDPLQYSIVDLASGKPVGVFALMRIDPLNGTIEVGGVAYSRRLQRTVAGTEAMFLLMRRVFDELGYRRFEWKCDHLNAPSRAAALRYGFRFEGIFRQVVVYKGRSRDTAWFAITDKEWPALREAYTAWLAPENFDEQGSQRKRLADLMGA
jgi:RimJ/RimL family protein N-acetyltransferase